jgi:hypothetical protein
VTTTRDRARVAFSEARISHLRRLGTSSGRSPAAGEKRKKREREEKREAERKKEEERERGEKETEKTEKTGGRRRETGSGRARINVGPRKTRSVRETRTGFTWIRGGIGGREE